MKNALNLENEEDAKVVTSERVQNIQKILLRKHRDLFLNGLDRDAAIIHQMNKTYILAQIRPFN